MTRALICGILLSLASVFALAQTTPQTPPAANDRDTVCTFANGESLSIRYPAVPVSKDDLARGKVWSPGDHPIYLFSETELQVGSTQVPPGAYSLYVIPGQQDWTLIINRGVDKGKPYDSSKDLAHINAPIEKLPSAADHLSLYFGHVAPKTCNLRIDLGKQRAVGEFTQK